MKSNDRTKPAYTSNIRLLHPRCTIISLRTLNRPPAERRAHFNQQHASLPIHRLCVFCLPGLSPGLPLRERARPRKWLVVGRQKRQHNSQLAPRLTLIGQQPLLDRFSPFICSAAIIILSSLVSLFLLASGLFAAAQEMEKLHAQMEMESRLALLRPSTCLAAGPVRYLK